MSSSSSSPPSTPSTTPAAPVAVGTDDDDDDDDGVGTALKEASCMPTPGDANASLTSRPVTWLLLLLLLLLLVFDRAEAAAAAAERVAVLVDASVNAECLAGTVRAGPVGAQIAPVNRLARVCEDAAALRSASACDRWDMAVSEALLMVLVCDSCCAPCDPASLSSQRSSPPP